MSMVCYNFVKKILKIFRSRELLVTRKSPGYAHDRGFGSSGKFWEIFLSRFHVGFVISITLQLTGKYPAGQVKSMQNRIEIDPRTCY